MQPSETNLINLYNKFESLQDYAACEPCLSHETKKTDSNQDVSCEAKINSHQKSASHEVIEADYNQRVLCDNNTEQVKDDSVIELRRTNVTINTLVIEVLIDNQPSLGPLTALIDTGAAVSILSVSSYQKLDKNLFSLASSSYKSVEGIGRVRFPVIGEVTLSLSLPSSSSKYMLKSSKFIVIPDGVSDYDMVIGYDLLKKEHLLPDSSEGELIYRNGKMVRTIATDVRKNADTPCQCVLSENINVSAKSCLVINIRVVNPKVFENQTMIFDPQNSEKVVVDPAVLSVNNNQASLILYNHTDSAIKMKRGQKIGVAESYDSQEASFHLIELAEQPQPQLEQWTSEALREAYRLGESNITPEQQQQLLELLERYPEVSSLNESDVGCTSVIKHPIETTTTKPIQVPVRRMQGPILKEIEKCCLTLEDEGIIRRSKSPYSAPVVPIRKKDGTIRLCIDYRELNKVTKGDSFLIPNLIYMLFSLFGNILIIGYYQIE